MANDEEKNKTILLNCQLIRVEGERERENTKKVEISEQRENRMEFNKVTFGAKFPLFVLRLLAILKLRKFLSTMLFD